MNKIEEYLNSLDKKNIMFLYVSVVIAAFIFYYNFNYSVLQKKIDTNNQEMITLENKLKKISILSLKLKKLKIKLKRLRKQNISLNEDLKYLNMLIKTSAVLHIDEKKFLSILKDILQKATNNNINASYVINKNIADFKTYIIEIKGEFDPLNFDKFYMFVKNLESIKAIKEIKNLNLSKRDNVKFEIKILFWSIL
jgi:predicted metal-dependent enzyme (double-stranded beta helix superfamily)